VLRLDSGLFFATAEALEERVRGLGDARTLVLDCRGINFIDSQGAETLDRIHEMMTERGGSLRLAQVKPQVLDLLRTSGFVARVGADHIYGNLDSAVNAELVQA
jgi:SulP family sulfate permease